MLAYQFKIDLDVGVFTLTQKLFSMCLSWIFTKRGGARGRGLRSFLSGIVLRGEDQLLMRDKVKHFPEPCPQALILVNINLKRKKKKALHHYRKVIEVCGTQDPVEEVKAELSTFRKLSLPTES